MKQINLYIAGLVVLFAAYSCQDVNDEFGLEIKSDPTTEEYTLISEDYEMISDLIVAGGASREDSSIAAFIAAYEHFNDTIKAADYIPLIMGSYFPGSTVGSGVIVTYNYNGEMPEEFFEYVDVLEYPLFESDYTSPDSVVNKVKYYSPSYPPHLYIPSILDRSVIKPDENLLLLVNYDYSDVDPIIDPNSSGDLFLFKDDFTGNTTLSNWNIQTTIGSNTWEHTSFDTDEYVRARTFDGSGNPPCTTYMITPALNLDENEGEIFSFSSAAYTHESTEAAPILQVKWSDNYDGKSDPSTADWNEFSEYTLAPTDAVYEWTSSGLISLDGNSGEIYIAFVFEGAEGDPTTWAVDNVKIYVPNAGISYVGEEPEAINEYYRFDTTSQEWSKVKDAYYVNAFDYKEMGSYYNNFSPSLDPIENIPNLLDNKYPTAINGTVKTIIYDYRNNINGTFSLLVDKYTLDSNEWQSTYNFINPKTDQFLIDGAGNWYFDPTISFTMAESDYQMVVDWVKENVDEDYIDSYGTYESYTGAGSYYENYDIRSGGFDEEVFETWEAAVEYSIGTILLPLKFPDAQELVDGVTMYFIVGFQTYDGGYGDYRMKFKVTKSGPDPEFTFVDWVD